MARFTNSATGQITLTSEHTAMIVNTNRILEHGADAALNAKGLLTNPNQYDGTTSQVDCVRKHLIKNRTK